jgi:hypothetical protein
MSWITNIFRKIGIKFQLKENDWYEFNQTNEYDLSGMPDLSKDSPIKSFKMTTYYRYCPVYKKLQSSKSRVNWRDSTEGTKAYILDNNKELMDFIDATNKIYERDQKINSILK